MPHGTRLTRVRLAVKAMATRFEIVIDHHDERTARAAGEEALSEIRRIEAQLSYFDPASIISRINRQAGAAPMRVPARVFRLLEQAAEFHNSAQGVFDLTVRPDQAGAQPPGMRHLLLDSANRTIAFRQPDVSLNLGGIGKGYAIDEACAILEEAGIENALIHGGTSTAHALGRDRGQPWRIALSHPSPDRAGDVIAWVDLENQALSASGIYGRGRMVDGQWVGHVVDPRTGEAVNHTELAAVVTDSSTSADALSTALLVLGDPSAPVFAGTLSLTISDTGERAANGPWFFPDPN